MFVSGSDYLMTSLTGNTSQVGNVFGFMDPISIECGAQQLLPPKSLRLLPVSALTSSTSERSDDLKDQ